MWKMFRCSFVFILFVTDIVIALSVESINNDLILKNVDRSIDISSQLAKVVHKITVENSGKSAIKNFLFAVEPQFKSKTAYVGAQV